MPIVQETVTEHARPTSATGWIGVDLDGTLAMYSPSDDIRIIGDPIPPMVDRIKKWLAQGWTVKIVTARVSYCLPDDHHDATSVANERLFVRRQHEIIKAWTTELFGRPLPAVPNKDYMMVELWDDRAVRVRHNTGHPCCDAWQERQGV